MIAPDVSHRASSSVLLKLLILVDNDSVITAETVPGVRQKYVELYLRVEMKD